MPAHSLTVGLSDGKHEVIEFVSREGCRRSSKGLASSTAASPLVLVGSGDSGKRLGSEKKKRRDDLGFRCAKDVNLKKEEK